MDPATIERACEAIEDADALLVGAGAGIGVDSGLPDFRGDSGFWKSYPPFKEAGLGFMSLANPKWFDQDPELAWGFYGHRLHLYRDTEPHHGFEVLRRLGDRMAHGSFVFTSNVDGQFQAAGFADAAVVECHGSIHHMQCARPCRHDIWAGDAVTLDVAPETFRARGELPTCPHCAQIARPNILMFGDGRWLGERSDRQEQRFRDWIGRVRDGRLVVVEAGAGTAVPTVRWQCERVADALDAALIRINPREAHGPAGTVSVAAGALEALEAIAARLGI